MARRSNAVTDTTTEVEYTENVENTEADNGSGESGLVRPRLDEPVRGDVGVRFDEIPSTTRSGFWARQKEFLMQHPGEYFCYEKTGASQVTQIRRRYGLDAIGKNHRKIDRDTGEVVGKDDKGSEVVDVWVAYRPDLEAKLLAGEEITDAERRGR